MTKQWTSRPLFVIGLGFAVLSVAFLWQAQGLILGDGHAHAHGGEAGAMTLEEFQERALAFSRAYAYEDGVRPPVAVNSDGHSDHDHGDGHSAAVDVYVMAYQWDFSPGTIYLKAGQDYRFRMMSMDVHHGFAITKDGGSQVWRLPPEVLVDATISFDEPGEYLIYCTYFCGGLHEKMMGKIVVEA